MQWGRRLRRNSFERIAGSNEVQMNRHTPVSRLNRTLTSHRAHLPVIRPIFQPSVDHQSVTLYNSRVVVTGEVDLCSSVALGHSNQFSVPPLFRFLSCFCFRIARSKHEITQLRCIIHGWPNICTVELPSSSSLPS